jgi:hypothetical protein
MNIKQLQEKAREGFYRLLAIQHQIDINSIPYNFREVILNHQDTIIEQTYKEAQQQERQRIIEEIEKMKKIYREPEFGPDGPDDGAIEAMISQQVDIAGYNEALQDIIKKL